MAKGLFITIEGMDGSGKTTQIEKIKEYFQQKGYEPVLTREPGGTKISEKIRNIILDESNTGMSPVTEMLLYASARAQLVFEVIKPALNQGKVVICDRFIDSSYAYQGYGRGIDLKFIENVNEPALDNVMPDITFFFDIEPKLALARRISATGADRIEKEKLEFHERVYKGYKDRAALFPHRIKIINANRSIEEISEEVRFWLNKVCP
ncbi:MAG TPA: dTMP kinase [Clostridiaceae bacterium]|nr:dTMP kinase [Clostridiaceae bacterium]